MLYLILALIIAGAITALLTWVFSRGKEESPIIQPPAGDCGSCDGNDERCEMECMMEAATQAIEYYEDEEFGEGLPIAIPNKRWSDSPKCFIPCGQRK